MGLDDFFVKKIILFAMFSGFLSTIFSFSNIFLKASLEVKIFNPHAIASSTALSRLPVSLRFINKISVLIKLRNVFIGYMSDKFNYTPQAFSWTFL